MWVWVWVWVWVWWATGGELGVGTVPGVPWVTAWGWGWVFRDENDDGYAKDE